MIKTRFRKSILGIVFTVIVLLFLTSLNSQNGYSEGKDKTAYMVQGQIMQSSTNLELIPDWVDQNFRWYGQGQITQTELLNAMKYLLDNNIMFISEEAAQEVQDLREKVEEQESAISSLRTLVTVNVLAREGGEDPDEGNDYSQSIVGLKGGDYTKGKLASYYEEITTVSEVIGELIDTGTATEDGWEDVIDQIATEQGYETIDSVVEDLQGIIVLCSIPIEKELAVISTELAYITDILKIVALVETDSTERSTTERYTGETTERDAYLDFMELKLTKIDSKIMSIQTGLGVLKNYAQDEEMKTTVKELQTEIDKQSSNRQALMHILRDVK